MRIDGPNPWSGIEALNSAQDEKLRSRSESATESRASDDAQLSPAARLASSLIQRLQQVPEVRQDKVEQLRNSIAQGTYQVSSDQIAGAMVNDARLSSWS